MLVQQDILRKIYYITIIILYVFALYCSILPSFQKKNTLPYMETHLYTYLPETLYNNTIYLNEKLFHLTFFFRFFYNYSE